MHDTVTVASKLTCEARRAPGADCSISFFAASAALVAAAAFACRKAVPHPPAAGELAAGALVDGAIAACSPAAGVASARVDSGLGLSVAVVAGVCAEGCSELGGADLPSVMARGADVLACFAEGSPAEPVAYTNQRPVVNVNPSSFHNTRTFQYGQPLTGLKRHHHQGRLPMSAACRMCSHHSRYTTPAREGQLTGGGVTPRVSPGGAGSADGMSYVGYSLVLGIVCASRRRRRAETRNVCQGSKRLAASTSPSARQQAAGEQAGQWQCACVMAKFETVHSRAGTLRTKSTDCSDMRMRRAAEELNFAAWAPGVAADPPAALVAAC